MSGPSVAETLAAYDALAPTYPEHVRSRAAYLEAVERIVVAEIGPGPASMLDVGAGDGERAVRIAAAAGIRELVLAEPSARMAERCRGRAGAEVWEVRAEELATAGRTFDAITCLWNVLGHVPGRAARVEGLRRMRSLLAPSGTIVLDVNHRYNASAYGWLRTVGRVCRDVVRPAETNGDVAVAWRVGETTVRAVGHVFTSREMAELARAAGLRVRRSRVVDYRTGAVRRWSWRGQLVYVLEEDAGAK